VNEGEAVLGDLLSGAGRSIVFGLVGIGLMAVGYVLIDLLTPGKLRDLIWVEKNPNASLLLAANQLGIAAIVFTAIFTSYDDFGQGLASTAIFGIIGIAIMGLAFLVLDWMTPGKLGDVICTPERHPGAMVSAASHFGAALIVCACIA
jgi:Na+-transporting methylmalonyl-CoA/oxaloacetate decarboxylase beta subunit